MIKLQIHFTLITSNTRNVLETDRAISSKWHDALVERGMHVMDDS